MIDLEELRREIADLLERHFRPMFRREVRLNFVAIHPSNPDAQELGVFLSDGTDGLKRHRARRGVQP